MSDSLPPQLGTTGRILEGLVTTCSPAGRRNVAPMGPLAGSECDTLILRPFASSTTYANLTESHRGVFHTTDDVLLIAQAAIGLAEPEYVETDNATVLAAACSWFAFEIVSVDNAKPRATMLARVTSRGMLREFLGFNRAQHAVIEAAILATRLHLLPSSHIADEFDRLRILVEKTGSDREHQAFALLKTHVDDLTLAPPRAESLSKGSTA